MDYFMEFHWWYILVGIILLFMFAGEIKGGIVVKRFVANMVVLDERFKECRPKAKYSIFEEGKPDHINIEVDNLSIPAGEELELQLNGVTFATVNVKKHDNEAEFSHWSDENVAFPVVNERDVLVVKYQKNAILKGVFRLDDNPLVNAF